jgi:multidrug resistance efflux pump
MRKLSLVVLAFATLWFVWYLVGDRLTPYTAGARVRAFVVPIVPQVSGYVTKVNVTNNGKVKAQELLVEISQEPYKLAVEKAEADLELAGQETGAQTAGIDSAEARVVEAKAKLANARAQGKRTFDLEKQGFATGRKGDSARAQIAEAIARVDKAEADLTAATSTAGRQGSKSANLRAARSALGNAKLNLEYTLLHAPSDGAVTDLQIDEGTYAKAGQPLMTFISFDNIWLEAYFKENNLGRMNVGDEVELSFDIAPGKVVKGKVMSFGYGASAGRQAQAGDLPTVENASGWLRDPQRFPVLISIEGYNNGKVGKLGVRANSQASAIVYTGNNGFWNALGRLWIRTVSYLSYAY